MDRKMFKRESTKKYIDAFSKVAKILLWEEDPDVFMEPVLKILGEITHADRTYWFRRFMRDGKWYLSQKYEWVREGASSQIDNPQLQNIPEDGVFTSYHDALLKGGILHALVKDLPEFDRKLLKAQEIKAILNIPLYIQDTFCGVIGFDNIHEEKLWMEEEVSALKLMADMIALSLLKYEKEQDRKKLTRRLETLMEVIPDFIIFKDNKGNWVYANNRVLEIFGLSKVDYRGKSDKELIRHVPEDLKDIFLKILKTDGERNAIYILKKNDKTYYIRPDRIIIQNPERDMGDTLIIGNDITNEMEIKKKEIALLEREAHLNKMEALGVITGSIAHDINNKLSVVIGNLSLLNLKIDDPSILRYAKDALEAIEEISAIVKRMLLFVGDEFHREDNIKLEEEIKDIVNEFREETNYEGEIKVSFPVEELPVKMTKFEFRELILNILVNAKEAMENSSEKLIKIILHKDHVVDPSEILYPLQMKSGEDYCIIDIRDTGEGISDDVLPHIFEPFYTTKFIGRGLGLSTVIGIMGAHGGGIDVVSSESGTTFSLYFPLRRGDKQ